MPLGDELRRRVIDTLQRGEELPIDWATELFPPERREIELCYWGKQRAEELAGEVMALPFQLVSLYGRPASADGWANMLVFGDNLQAARHLVEMKRNGGLRNADGTPGVRLAYLDPPFATLRDFSGSDDEKAYQDKLADAEFVEFLRRRLILVRETLADDGSLFVHLDNRKVHYMKVILDEIFGEQNFRNEIILPGRASKNLQQQFETVARLNVRHDTLLWYSASSKTRFQPLWVEKHVKGNPEGHWHHFWSNANRPTMRYELFGITPKSGQWTWKESVAREAAANYERFLREAGGRTLAEYWRDTGSRLRFIRQSPDDSSPQYWRAPTDIRIADTVWSGIPVYANLTHYPTEKNEALLAQVLNLASSEGDLVLDAFAGSGTTLAVAEKLGRRWIGIDSGKLAVYTIQKRMLTLHAAIGNGGECLTPSAFRVFNAGLYDFHALKDLDWPSWLFFALELFGCRKEERVIRGVKFHGSLHGAPVLVHDHIANPKARLDEAAVTDLHAILGEAAGPRVFVIAPRTVFRFQQDYIDFGGTRYYALRIPYSFIQELHRRGFSALKQANDKNSVNATVEAIGFDFIEPPTVEIETAKARPKGSRRMQPSVRLTSFESHSRLSDPHKQGFDAFSMLLVDHDFDGRIFDMDEVFFGEDLKNNDWIARLDPESLGTQVMLVFMDIYGNEARHVVDASAFRGSAT